MKPGKLSPKNRRRIKTETLTSREFQRHSNDTPFLKTLAKTV